MDWMRTSDRLWLLSMMTLGCVTGSSADGDDTAPGSTGNGTSAGPGGDGVMDTTNPPLDTTADSTSTAADGITAGSTSAPGTTTDGGATDEGPTTTVGGSDSGSSGEGPTTGEPASPFVEACIALYTAFGDCTGYNYDEATLLAYCTEYENYAEMYGAECLSLLTDYSACLSALPCQALTMSEGIPADCVDEYTAGYDACPETFPFCQAGGGGGGADSCMVEATECVNGNSYSVECAGTACTCLVNGVETGMFNGPMNNDCLDPDFGDAAIVACGFPDGVFL